MRVYEQGPSSSDQQPGVSCSVDQLEQTAISRDAHGSSSVAGSVGAVASTSIHPRATPRASPLASGGLKGGAIGKNRKLAKLLQQRSNSLDPEVHGGTSASVGLETDESLPQSTVLSNLFSFFCRIHIFFYFTDFPDPKLAKIRKNKDGKPRKRSQRKLALPYKECSSLSRQHAFMMEFFR